MEGAPPSELASSSVAAELAGAPACRRLWAALVGAAALRADTVNAFLVLSGARDGCVLDDSFWDAEAPAARARFLAALRALPGVRQNGGGGGGGGFELVQLNGFEHALWRARPGGVRPRDVAALRPAAMARAIGYGACGGRRRLDPSRDRLSLQLRLCVPEHPDCPLLAPCGAPGSPGGPGGPGPLRYFGLAACMCLPADRLSAAQAFLATAARCNEAIRRAGAAAQCAVRFHVELRPAAAAPEKRRAAASPKK